MAKALAASSLLGAGAANAEIDYAGIGYLGGQSKIDVNNANVRVYAKKQGLYPNAAGKMVAKAPFNQGRYVCKGWFHPRGAGECQ